MANPRKHGRRRRRRELDAAESAESRVAEALTVAWMLTTFSTMLGSAAALIVAGVGAMLTADAASGAALLARVLWFAGLVSGLATLILTPLVHWQRRVSPPVAISILAIVAGLCPWGAVAAAFISRL